MRSPEGQEPDRFHRRHPASVGARRFSIISQAGDGNADDSAPSDSARHRLPRLEFDELAGPSTAVPARRQRMALGQRLADQREYGRADEVRGNPLQCWQCRQGSRELLWQQDQNRPQAVDAGRRRGRHLRDVRYRVQRDEETSARQGLYGSRRRGSPGDAGRLVEGLPRRLPAHLRIAGLPDVLSLTPASCWMIVLGGGRGWRFWTRPEE